MFPPTDIGAVHAHADALSELTGRLEPNAVPLPEAPGMWVAFDRIECLAAGTKLLLAQRVDESQVWQHAGDRDAGVWMARHAGTTITAARTGLAASKRLTGLSDTAAALRRCGAGSYQCPKRFLSRMLPRGRLMRSAACWGWRARRVWVSCVTSAVG